MANRPPVGRTLVPLLGYGQLPGPDSSPPNDMLTNGSHPVIPDLSG